MGTVHLYEFVRCDKTVFATETRIGNFTIDAILVNFDLKKNSSVMFFKMAAIMLESSASHYL